MAVSVCHVYVDVDSMMANMSVSFAGGKCLLGHKVTYTRRKREAACFNPQKLETAVTHDNCACTEEDFECDYGYAGRRPRS